MRTVPSGIVVTVLLVALVTTAQPAAAASSNLAVASRHTTFGTTGNESTPTLSNLTIAGTGTDASVIARTADSFEDGTLDRWTQYPSGDWNTTTAVAKNGSTAATRTDTTSDHRFLVRGARDGGTVSGWIRDDSSGETAYVGLALGVQDSENGYFMQVGGGVGLNLKKLDGGTETSLNQTAFAFSEDTWYWAELTRSGDTITARVYDGRPSNGGTMLAEASATDSTFGAGAYGAKSYRSSMQVDLLGTGEPWTGTGTYIGTPHSASNLTEASVTITTLENVSAEVTAQYNSGSGWTNATSTTVTSAGVENISLPDTNADEWRIRIDTAATGESPDFALASESVLFNPAMPSATNLAPADGAELSGATAEFSLNISDADFTTAQHDSVNATLQLKAPSESGWTNATSTTVSSSGPVSVTETLAEGGDWQYRWHVADSYGNTNTTAERNISVPADLEIIDEENETLIDNATVRLKFYLENDTDTRVVETSTSNGTVDFAALDLPTDEPFVVTASADGYVSRRIYVPSLFDQQRVYLLNDSAPHRDIIFELRDFSGQFPESQTVLLIQRSINGSYQTVQSDFFGATGEFTAQLAYNERHRLILLNTRTGEREPLGPFTPLTDSRSVLKITQDGEIRVLDDVPIVRVAPSLDTLPATASTELSVEIVEQATAISEWRVTATYVNGSTSTELANISSSEASTPASFTVDLSDRTAGKLWVNTTFTLVDGTSATLNDQFTIRQYARNEHSLLNIASGVTGLIPAPDVSLVTTLLALLTTVGLTVGIASSVSIPTEAVGTIAVASLMGFGVLGWISYQIPFVAGVTLLAAAGLRRGI